MQAVGLFLLKYLLLIEYATTLAAIDVLCDLINEAFVVIRLYGILPESWNMFVTAWYDDLRRALMYEVNF